MCFIGLEFTCGMVPGGCLWVKEKRFRVEETPPGWVGLLYLTYQPI